MSPDISKSWQEIKCAIIEVNTKPGVAPWQHAEDLLLRSLPNGNKARIPTVLLIGDCINRLNQCIDSLKIDPSLIGFVDHNTIRLGPHHRVSHSNDMHERCATLIMEPRCEALIVNSSFQVLVSKGPPLDYFDFCLVPEEWSQHASGFNAVLKRHCGEYQVVRS